MYPLESFMPKILGRGGHWNYSEVIVCEKLDYKCRSTVVSHHQHNKAKSQWDKYSIKICAYCVVATSLFLLATHLCTAATERLFLGSAPSLCEQKHAGFWVKLQMYMHPARCPLSIPSKQGAQLQLQIVLFLQNLHTPLIGLPSFFLTWFRLLILRIFTPVRHPRLEDLLTETRQYSRARL